jgi:Short C-terminal domain
MGMLRRRRPLLRAAAVGGGAYVMGKRHAEQAGAEQQQAPPPAAPVQPAGGPSDADIGRLQELAKLRDQGVLSDEEFAQQKARILG